MLLALPFVGKSQFTYWNNIYPEADSAHNTLHTDLFAEDDHYLSLGILGSWTQFGCTKRKVDSTGIETASDFASLGTWAAATSGNDTFTNTQNDDYLCTLVLGNEWGNAYPWLLCLNSDFDTLWTRNLDFMADSVWRTSPLYFFELSDGQLLLVGDRKKENPGDPSDWGYRFSRFTADGELTYDQIFLLPEGVSYHPHEAHQLTTGEIVMGGIYFHDNEYDVKVSKHDIDGNELEYMILGNPDDCIEADIEMWYQNDEHVYVLYQHCIDQPFSAYGLFKPLLLELDATEWVINWEYEYNEIELFQEYGAGANLNGMTKTSDNGFAVVMTTSIPNTSFDIAILKADSLGNYEWFKLYEPPMEAQTKQAQDIVLAHDSGFVVTGVWYSDDEPFIQRNWMFKTDPCGDLVWVDCPGGVGVDEFNSQVSGFRVFPNPVESSVLSIQGSGFIERIEISNLTGKIVFSQTINSKSAMLNLSNLASGVYLLVASGSEMKEVVKVVVE